MTWELVAIIGLSAVIVVAWCYLAHAVFTEGAKIRRAQRDANLSALKMSGQDRTRHMDLHV